MRPRLPWSLRGARLTAALLALLAAEGLHAAASVLIATSNSSPVAGGPAFNYTVTVASDVVGASNVRMTFPLPPGARFLNLTISGPSAGAFQCQHPGNRENGLVSCDASSMPAISSADIAVVADFDAFSGGVVDSVARVVSDLGFPPSSASVQQTVGNNSTFATAIDDGASGSLFVRRVIASVGGNSARVAPTVTTTLPSGAYLAWFESTGDIVDSCSFVASTSEVRCEPAFLRSGFHRVTIVYGVEPRLFRNGFE